MNTVYCNPINLPYRFQKFKNKKAMHREAADPSVVLYKDRYWLFASMSAGFWVSSDLLRWKYYSTPDLPTMDYAPDVRVIDEELYFCASRRTKKCPIYKTQDPINGKWEKVSEAFAFWDPNLYQDDDGRVYFYWGCSNRRPIYGVEINKETMTPIGEKTPLIYSDATNRGWEINGENNILQKPKSLISLLIGDSPFIEGAWMTKNNGKYYLQYSAPGTQHNIYGDGVFIGESPLGPFSYAKHNPFSLKPGGFIQGAGHGSTFEDVHGNLWHISTMRISLNHMFERRIGLFPAGFDKDGVLFCNTNFADYPTKIPTQKWNPWTDSTTGWMLLSYKKNVKVSSTLEEHTKENAVDESIRTFWAAQKTDKNPWLEIDLDAICTVNAVQINFTEKNCYPKAEKVFIYEKPQIPFLKRAIDEEIVSHQYVLEGSHDALQWEVLIDKANNSSDVPHDFIVFDQPRNIRYIRLTGYDMPYNGNFAISGLRVFGKGNGDNPGKANIFIAKKTGKTSAKISWKKIGNATGYNVRWGIAADKLYSSWLLYEQTELELNCLNSGTNYFVAVDTFNENGITLGETHEMERV